MVKRFLTADEYFLARLVSAVETKCADVGDGELASAIVAATKRDQKSEMLWLKTVPAAVANLRRTKTESIDTPAPDEDLDAFIREHNAKQRD
jgi:hypothetical protein